jgi:hypothetical protein
MKHTDFPSAEDRALRGRNPSAAWRLQTAERPGTTGVARPILLLEQLKSDKSQGGLGDSVPQCPQPHSVSENIKIISSDFGVTRNTQNPKRRGASLPLIFT